MLEGFAPLRLAKQLIQVAADQDILDKAFQSSATKLDVQHPTALYNSGFLEYFARTDTVKFKPPAIQVDGK